MKKFWINTRLQNVLFLLFVLSGFSGLIYESIWTHDLKLFLGHAAYAQTLVLSIFMGGMALGSWICSNYSKKSKRPLIGYAVVECVIGLFALVFHNIFDNILQFSYASIIPDLKNPATINAFKWTLSALLILPQSILLGMTFPLMSAGIIRIFSQRPGRSIAMLYFTNSIGAAIGVLVSGFLLIKLSGLPGTMRIAGVINILLALTVWLLIKDKETGYIGFAPEKDMSEEHPADNFYLLFLVISLFTGTASFIYEIGWIRMLGLVLGSSTHAFELMLSAFIFGLAFGGLWIKNRIDRIVKPIRFLVYVQAIMGIFALSTLLLYGKSFAVMQWLLGILDRTDTGYAIFSLSSHAIALAIMVPTTFCAGMTLPLITYIQMKRGYGEKSIGAVYATNTVGAIIGVFFAVHIGMPFFGLKGLLILGAGLDIALGLVLLWSVSEKYTNNRLPIAITALCVSAIFITMLTAKLDPYKMASGVYRDGSLLTPLNSKLIYHKDGETATVSLNLLDDGVMSIRTNGKIDAGIMMDPYKEANVDETTMVLLAVIPMSSNPQAKTVANIGLGSGLTTHTFLSNPMLEQVDTVEIERKMVEAAKSFGDRVDMVYKDTRSRIYIDDAKTFFASRNKKYDIIVSEPSNPWVSGVSSLFSIEFYHLVQRYLSESGLFAQWIHLYSIDSNLVVSVLKALSSEFQNFVIYALNNGDLLIIAGNDSAFSNLDTNILKLPQIAKALKRIYVETLQDIEIRKIGNKKVLIKLIETYPIRANSDYYPVLDQNAERARFLRTEAQDLIDLYEEPLPLIEMLTGPVGQWKDTKISMTPFFPKAESAFRAMALRDYFLNGKFSLRYWDIPEDIKQKAIQVNHLFQVCNSRTSEDERVTSMFDVFKNMTPYLSPKEIDDIWKKLQLTPCISSFTKTEKQWLSLFKAIGKRDAANMANMAKNLLESRDITTQDRTKYLLASGMLGFLAQDNKGASLKLWSDYQHSVFGTAQPELLFRLLVADSAIH